MSDDIVIRIEGLWKRYGLPLPGMTKKGINWLYRIRNVDDDFWALREINLEVKRGETLGIIGRNGAGKSTLLKILAGVTPPTRGQVEVLRYVFPMIELNAGLHMELTGRENVYLLGAVMGLTRAETAANMKDIEDFCELGESFDLQVRKYSSGMVARLGFAVAMNVNADILLVDEILAVGDITFQRKCLDRMERLQDSGVTIIFVSHSIRQVERLCTRAVLLEEGRLAALGDAGEVACKYYEKSNKKIIQQREADGKANLIVHTQMENAVVDILDIRLIDEIGRECSEFYTGCSLTIEVGYDSHILATDVFACFGIATVDSFYVSGFTNELNNQLLTLEGRGSFRCVIKDLPLLSGVYVLHLKLRNRWGGVLGGGFALKTCSVVVPENIRRSNDFGLVRLKVEWP